MEQIDMFNPPSVASISTFLSSPLNANHRRYLIWRKENGDVLRVIKQHCLRLYREKRRFGLRLVINYVRFNEYFSQYRDEPYRISNNHTPYIARELLGEYPEMKEYLSIRPVQGEDDEE